MEDVRVAEKKYELLVSLSAEVSSCAHGLSTALHEMASYFVAPGVLDDQYQDVGRVFELVGRVQFEISKSLELYASHVTQTVTTPTENLIVELQNVLETKQQYDVKRQSLDSHRLRIARWRLKSGRGDKQDEEQLETVKEEFEEARSFLGDQLSSLRQSRSQRLITQAARHHAAQMKLFSRGLISLHDIEPHMKQVIQELNIDQRLSSADADDSEVEDGVSSDLMNGNGHFDDLDGEMGHHRSRDELDSGSSENGGNAMLNMSQEWSSYIASTSDKIGTSGNDGFDSPLPQWVKGSKSTPTSPLPTSDDDKVDNFHHHNVMPTNSLVHKRTTKMGVPMTIFQPSDHSLTIQPMPLPLPADIPILNIEPPGSPTSDFSQRRYSYSGPLTSAKPIKSHASIVPSSGPLFPSSNKSRQLHRTPRQAHSPRSSLVTSPKTSPSHFPELYKLPPPPLSATSSPRGASSNIVPYSAPLHRHETNMLHPKRWTWA